MNIIGRPAYDNEKIDVDPESEAPLPSGVVAFDNTDWECQVFCLLLPGDWTVEISDPNHSNMLNNAYPGLFHVHMSEEGDGGLYRKVEK